MATSGMPMPTAFAWAATVSTSQASVASAGRVMSWAPVDHLAMGLEISSAMKAPAKPTTSENTSSMGRLRPFALMNLSTPSTDSVTDSTSMIARLVTRNSTMRFMSCILLGHPGLGKNPGAPC